MVFISRINGFSHASSFIFFLKTVSAYAASGFIRYPILLEGSIGWSEEVIKEYIAHSGYLDSDIEVYGNLSIGELPSLEMKAALKKIRARNTLFGDRYFS